MARADEGERRSDRKKESEQRRGKRSRKGEGLVPWYILTLSSSPRAQPLFALRSNPPQHILSTPASLT
ncbi:hypothetical protein B0H19DRAFT_1145790 [Mycena capillaripes]|nr:hypothetical protein B0H19DRAFT_1145790 [Mycena capillaripes]